jgi:hypothetical protein
MRISAALVFSSLLSLAPLLAQTPAARGDFNTDGSVNTTDVNGLSDHLLGSGTGPSRACAADVNADSGVSSMDALRLIDYVVAGGQAPPAQPTEICDDNDNDCDGQADEDWNKMTDFFNCGACGNVCPLANAVSECVSGACFSTCDSGFASCDGNAANGCETALDTNPACTGAEVIGLISGDSGSQVIMRQGQGEHWVRFRLVDSAVVVPQRARISLNVPADVDFDIYAYTVSCGGQLRASSVTQGDESMLVQQSDSGSFADDSIDVLVEIRFAEGSSCDTWILTVEGNRN